MSAPAQDAAGTRPVLRTPRLVLRPFVADDLPALVEAIDDPQIAANTLTIPHPYTEEHGRAFLARVAEDTAAGRSAVFAVCDAASGALVGACGLHIERAHERAEMGYWIARAWRGRGLAREATRALLDHAFTDLGLGRVFASHFPGNPASGRVMAAIGMRPEGTLRGHSLKHGRRIDGVLYGILREDHVGRAAPSPGGPGTERS